MSTKNVKTVPAIRLSLFILFLFLVYPNFAQEGNYVIGFEAGPARTLFAVPDFKDDPGIGVELGAPIGFQIGLQHDVWQRRAWKTSLYAAWAHFQPTVELYQNAYGGGSSQSGQFTFDQLYLSLLPAIRLDGSIQTAFSVGGYAGFTFNDPKIDLSRKRWNLFDQSTEEEQLEVRQRAIWNRWNAGLEISVGFVLPKYLRSYSLRVFYRHGLSDQQRREIFPHAVKTRHFGLLLGYHFYRISKFRTYYFR
ncbi:hypothetical protein [Flavilitoribacter nigricans]|uniref:Outer membrane protein beta-barrel domain-containing protein n=1 Tax=Flavilitoribacter nigricans (strain ATCC 23147 / DSM 23189 / NBRC 102662 / NCIMB 1420 / SS-2) TaxID=1122177 RepID=A0A2D0N0A4_FLAN2|nr:hypothetical protein [Flavilitoribacter nigricans]PHN01806.1 hypothetical protein CRP01_35580 [Flavilitoribacter nigricans DSM 23189 = NBRC 102662]